MAAYRVRALRRGKVRAVVLAFGEPALRSCLDHLGRREPSAVLEIQRLSVGSAAVEVEDTLVGEAAWEHPAVDLRETPR